MLRVTPNGPNRADIEFRGKLDKDEMEAALAELKAKTKGIEHGRMLYRVGDFKLPTRAPFESSFRVCPQCSA
jgi:hypothetical protein